MTHQTKPHILILAGGTGGHIFPGLAVASELQQRDWKVSWLGSVGGMEEVLVKQDNIERFLISINGLRGNGLIGWVKAPFKLFLSVRQAIKIIKICQPDIVIGFGGFASGPGGIAAFLLGKILVVHEQNAVPGLTNRILSRVASLVIAAFPNTFKQNTAHMKKRVSGRDIDRYRTMGNPLREEIQNLSKETKTKINRPVQILVLGGSRGAQSLNKQVPKIIAGLIENDAVKVKHQCGNNKLEETQKGYQSISHSTERVAIVEFIDDMTAAYRWADLVICRAGALTVSEIAAVGIAAVFVPYPYAVDDHQTVNAQWLENAQAALVIQEKELKDSQLIQTIASLIDAPQKLQKMANRGRDVAYINATQSIADACEVLVGEAA